MRISSTILLALGLSACTGEVTPAEDDAGTTVRPGTDAGRVGVDAGMRRDAYLPPVDPNCPAGAVFCESFESEELDPARWEMRAADGAIILDDAFAADGTQSLRVRMGDSVGFPGAQNVDLLVGIPAPEDRLYARWFMRFTDLRLPGYHPNFVRVVNAEFTIGEWPMFQQHSFGSFAGSFSINHFGPELDQARLWGGWDAEETDLGDDTPDTEQHLNAGEWFCVEIMLYGDDEDPGDTEHDDEETVVWLDGVEIEDLHATDEQWPNPEHWSPRYDGSRWTFGIDGAYTNVTSTELWYDAIVFSNERIGCER